MKQKTKKYLYLQFLLILFIKISNEKLISVITLTGYNTGYPDLQRNISFQNQTENYSFYNSEFTSNGEFFKDLYSKKQSFLSKNFDPTEIKFYSVDHPTIISNTIGFIKGFYSNINIIPTMNKSKPSSLLDKSYINLYINNPKNDYILNPYDCLFVKKNHIKKQLKKIIDDQIFEINSNEKSIVIEEYLKNLNISFKKNITDIEEKSSFLINYLVKNNIKENVKNVSKSSKEIMKKMILNEFYSPFLSGDEFAKITSSAFLEHIIKLFNIAKVQKFLKNNQQKFFSYHAFTLNIIDVIGNLFEQEKLKNIIEESINNQEEYDFLIPNSGTTILFELFNDDLNEKNYYIKILVNGKVIENNLDTEQERYYNGEIPYNDFKNLIWESISEDYHSLFCGKQYVYQQIDLLNK